MKEILRILEKDARKTPQQIATMTGIPADQVKDAIKRAESDRTIMKYKTVVNWDRLGEEQVRALVEIRVAPQRDVGFDAIAERIYRFPEARSVYLVSGTYDVAVLVEGATMQEVASFVSEKIAPMESVQGTVTHFLLKRYKEDGELIELEERPQRVPLMP
jgi:DNA-binding Lrp family transcriptional regulator